MYGNVFASYVVDFWRLLNLGDLNSDSLFAKINYMVARYERRTR